MVSICIHEYSECIYIYSESSKKGIHAYSWYQNFSKTCQADLKMHTVGPKIAVKQPMFP